MNIFTLLPIYGLTDGDPPPTSPPGDGGVVPQWASNFPGELTGDEGSRTFLSRFKGDGDKVEVPTELVKSAIESQKMIGGMVRIPAENASAADIDVYNKKIGVPDSAEGYEFKLPDGSPEGLFSDDMIKAVKADGKELGIPKAKLEVLFDRFAGRQIESYNGIMAGNQKTLQERIDALKTDLGSEYDNTLKVADKAAMFADPAMFDVLNKVGLSGHPAIVKGFAKIGKALGEGMLKGVDTGVPDVKHSKEELEGMMRDPKYKLPEGDPVGKAWRAKVEEGFKLLYPGAGGGDIGPSAGRALHGA